MYDASGYKFTGKERDSETGLDYFGARYYGSNMGRWMSPDWAADATAVPYADFVDPQTLNLYGYTRNNPIAHADADGHCWPLCTILAGAAAGAVAGGVAEYVGEKLQGKEADWGKIGKAALAGSVAGGITATLGPEAGVALKLTVSVGAQVVSGGLERGMNGEKIVKGTEIAKDAVSGLVGSKLEGVAEKQFAAKAVQKVVPAVAETVIDAGKRGAGEEKKPEASSPTPEMGTVPSHPTRPPLPLVP